MTTTPDYAQMMRDMMAKMPMDASAMQHAYKSQAQLAERMGQVAIEAAQKSTDLSARWMQDTLAKMQGLTRAKDEPADYAKAMSDFVQASTQASAEHVAAFAEIAKKVQAETMELMLAAGRDMGEDARRAQEQMAAAMQPGQQHG